MHHPLAYLEHRSAFTRNFLAGSNLTSCVADIEHSLQKLFLSRSASTALGVAARRAQADAVVSRRVVVGAVPGRVLIGLAARRYAWGAFVLGTCGSTVIYVLSYYPVGVAFDFRYDYWAVVAGLVGAVVVAAPSRSLRT